MGGRGPCPKLKAGGAFCDRKGLPQAEDQPGVESISEASEPNRERQARVFTR
jgi:hypothetical protein